MRYWWVNQNRLTAIDKALPHDDVMERAVLGAILAGHPQSIGRAYCL